MDESGKPFWMKFFKADYLEEGTAAASLNKLKQDTIKGPGMTKAADTVEK